MASSETKDGGSLGWEPGALVLDGRFKVLALLGKGGVTEVYLAEHPQLGRKVVLKVLRQDLGVAEGVGDRFAQEVRKLAQVDHPAVVRVLDFATSGPLMVLVTEVAEGQSLRALLTGEALMPDRAVALTCQIAEGLAAIHASGLVHRDLKPENVFVASGPDGERVRLSDFGIARLVDPEAEAERVTLLMKPVGLPRYMSPEQAFGRPTDARSDVYALGLLAYELLSGRSPFDGPGPADYLLQHQEKPPLPLLEAAPHLVDHVKLCALVARCLEKDPSRRPAGAREVAQQLGRVPQVGEPTILMEALQLLPPALPVAAKKLAPEPAVVAPAPVAVASAAPVAPGALLPSLVMPSVTQAQRVVASAEPSPLMPPPPAPAAPPMSRLKTGLYAAAATAAALGVLALVLTFRPAPPDQARALLEAGKPDQALAVLQEALKQKGARSDPKIIALLAATLHRLDRHRDEVTLFRDELAPKAPEVLEPLVLSGLLEDLARREDGPSRELLKRLPREALYPVLKDFVAEKPSLSQWGALRYLDLEQAASELDLLALYVAALESENCAVRRVAAKRLGLLGDLDAAEALTRLKATPRTDTPEKACGQDEAAAALAALGKKKP